MVSPISQSTSKRAVDAGSPEALAWAINRELRPILDAIRGIVNEEWTAAYGESIGAVEWDLDRQGILFVSHTSGAALNVSTATWVDLTKLRPGRGYRLIVHNSSGVLVTPTFGAEYRANTPGIANGATASWQFVVKHPDMAVLTETLIETE